MLRMMTRRDALSTTALYAVALGTASRADAQSRQMTAEEQTNMRVVDDFIAAFNARDTKRVATYLSADARFSAGPIGKFAPLRPPVPLFDNFIASTQSVKMTVKPGSQLARGPMVTHERVDQMVLQNGTTNGSGTFFAVFGLREGKIVDFIDFQIA
jgi:limonene-1,2-epoxide hydrolase